MIRTSYLLMWLFLFLGISLNAQEQEVMSKNYLFADGLYLTFDDFKNNKPAYQWSDVKVNVFQNPLTFTAKSDQIFYIPEEDIKLEKVWGFCADGIPYINLKLENTVLEQYAGIRVRGKICYYTYEEEHPKTAAITAYNPYTKRPFRTGEVSVNEKVRSEMMMRLDDGVIERFTLANFKHWIEDDVQLSASLTDLSREDVAEKLFKCLLIYNDRNQVMVNKTPSQK